MKAMKERRLIKKLFEHRNCLKGVAKEEMLEANSTDYEP